MHRSPERTQGPVDYREYDQGHIGELLLYYLKPHPAADLKCPCVLALYHDGEHVRSFIHPAFLSELYSKWNVLLFLTSTEQYKLQNMLRLVP